MEVKITISSVLFYLVKNARKCLRACLCECVHLGLCVRLHVCVCVCFCGLIQSILETVRLTQIGIWPVVSSQWNVSSHLFSLASFRQTEHYIYVELEHFKSLNGLATTFQRKEWLTLRWIVMAAKRLNDILGLSQIFSCTTAMQKTTVIRWGMYVLCLKQLA